MNRRRFITKNQLNIRSFLFVTLMLVVLTVFFLVLGNSASIAEYFEKQDVTARQETINNIVNSDKTTAELLKKAALNTTNISINVGIYGENACLLSLKSQMLIMKQSCFVLESLDRIGDAGLIIVGKDSLSANEISKLQEYVDNGGSVWFCSTMTEDTYKNTVLREMMGIEESGSLTRYEGIRFSTDLIPFNNIIDAEEAVYAINVSLRNDVKIYACALPWNYLSYENEDLPPILWRFVKDKNSGYVYVSNGDCFDNESIYALLPEIMFELQDTYIYSIINAYCFSVQNYPLTTNESNEQWTKFYSRDLFGIQRDMFYTLFMRFPVIYDTKNTFFTPDYSDVKDSSDSDITQYNSALEESGGELLPMVDGKPVFSSESSVTIQDWEPGTVFFNEEQNTINLPIDYNYKIADNKLNLFSIAGSAYGLGYYSLSTDTYDLLYNNSDSDQWEKYSSNLETALGISKRDYNWIERTTFSEALYKLYALLTDNPEISITENDITISTEREDGSFILKSKHENLSITDPSVNSLNKINDYTYIVTIRNKKAVISWEE